METNNLSGKGWTKVSSSSIGNVANAVFEAILVIVNMLERVCQMLSVHWIYLILLYKKTHGSLSTFIL